MSIARGGPEAAAGGGGVAPLGTVSGTAGGARVWSLSMGSVASEELDRRDKSPSRRCASSVTPPTYGAGPCRRHSRGRHADHRGSTPTSADPRADESPPPRVWCPDRS